MGISELVLSGHPTGKGEVGTTQPDLWETSVTVSLFHEEYAHFLVRREGFFMRRPHRHQH
jgi:hypothetical protein